jgi:hypothetical protein
MVHKAEHLPVTLTIGTTEHSYNIEVDQYRRTTVPTLREQRDMSDEPGEQSIDSQFWLRSQTDWSYGAGQTFFDIADANRGRFSSSSGVDVWTQGQISLLPMCESKNNAEVWTNVIMKIFKAVSGTEYMYVASAGTLKFSSNFSAADGSVTWTAVGAPASGAASTIKDIVSDGTSIFICYGDARVPTKGTLGATTQPTNNGSLNPDYLRLVGGRLFGIDGSNLAEYDIAAAKVSNSVDSTLFGAGLWVTVCTGPVGFYAASNTAGTGAVSFIAIGDADGLLQEPQQVAELPRGEEINDMISYGGFLVIATTKGLRLAAIDPGSGSVTYGPAVDDVGEVYSLTADERFVWFGGGSGKVYRADLSRFTETLVPAWAEDVVSVKDATSGGADASPSNVTHVARSGGETYFVDSANGVQGEMSTGQLVATGTMTVGDVKWNSQFDKILRTIEIRSAPGSIVAAQQTWADADVEWADPDEFWVGQTATVGGSITATVTNDENYSVTTGTLTNKTPVDVATLVPELSEAFKVQLNLTRDSVVTAGPQIESWKIQAFPAPTRVDEIILPIILKTRVATSRGRGTAKAYDTRSEYDALRTAMTAKKVITYQEGSRSDTAVIDQIAMSAEKLSDDGDWWEGVCTLRLLTVP